MKEGDFARVDFIARDKSNAVLDTTLEEEAKKAGIYDESSSSNPG